MSINGEKVMRVVAAAAAGLLVGFFVGSLDSSAIIGSVMTAILAIVTTLLGATKLGFIAGNAGNSDYEIRVTAFSLATLAALFLGTWFKQNSPGAPTLASQYAAFRAIGYPEADARDLAVYSIYKLAPKDRTAK